MDAVPWPNYGICPEYMCGLCSMGPHCQLAHPPNKANMLQHYSLVERQCELIQRFEEGDARELSPQALHQHGRAQAAVTMPQFGMEGQDEGEQSPGSLSPDARAAIDLVARHLAAEDNLSRGKKEPQLLTRQYRMHEASSSASGTADGPLNIIGRRGSLFAPKHESRAGLAENVHASRQAGPSFTFVPPPPTELDTSLEQHGNNNNNIKRKAESTEEMGAHKRSNTGEVKIVGPHPSTISVSAQYISQAVIDACLKTPGMDFHEQITAEAKEDSLRLQGVAWLDSVRRAMSLPVRTYTTACRYFHRFRLTHPPGTTTGDGYIWSDAAAASLLTACKVEDTLKKSRDILAAAYNLKVTATHEQVGADDPIFEQPSRVVIGLERLVLEASRFDFRSRDPYRMLVKIAKSLSSDEKSVEAGKLAWIVMTDVHRTFAPLKHTSATMSFAALELAARLLKAGSMIDAIQKADLAKFNITRPEVMEVIMDTLDHYTHVTHQTTHPALGPRFSLDEFLPIRVHFNKECASASIPRYCQNQSANLHTSKVQNGHPTPVSPPDNIGLGNLSSVPNSNLQFADPMAGGGTMRFMFQSDTARKEKEEVQKYVTDEYEEYEEEIEVPQPRQHHQPSHPGSSRASSRDRRSDSRREDLELNSRLGGAHRNPPRAIDRDRERDAVRDRERGAERDREHERERVRPRHRNWNARFDDDRRRGYDDRVDRRFEDERRRRFDNDRNRR